MIVLNDTVVSVKTVLRNLPHDTLNRIDEFSIFFCGKVATDKYLFVSIVEYKELISVQSSYEQIITLHPNFEVIINREENVIKVYSDLYTAILETNLRNDFARVIFEVVKPIVDLF